MVHRSISFDRIQRRAPQGRVNRNKWRVFSARFRRRRALRGRVNRNMSDMTEARQLLLESGWLLARKNDHEIWRCPCGQYQITLAVTPSDHRSVKNAVAQIWRTGCSSLPLE